MPKRQTSGETEKPARPSRPARKPSTAAKSAAKSRPPSPKSTAAKVRRSRTSPAPESSSQSAQETKVWETPSLAPPDLIHETPTSPTTLSPEFQTAAQTFRSALGSERQSNPSSVLERVQEHLDYLLGPKPVEVRIWPEPEFE